LSFVTPPPFDAVFGAAAVGFSLYSGINNIRHHRWGAAAGDFLSAIPGAGSLGRGYRAFRAGRRAFRAGRTLQREAKYFRGARRAKRAYKSILHRHKHARWWHNAVKERWGRRDLRYAYPGSWGYTGCKYSSSCSHSRFSRWSRLF